MMSKARRRKCEQDAQFSRLFDDIFVLFRSPHHLEKFNDYLNVKHVNIKFTNEKEINGSLPFLHCEKYCNFT